MHEPGPGGEGRELPPSPGTSTIAIFLVVKTMKSPAETDASMKASDKFAAGEDGICKMIAASVETDSTNLSVIHTGISNPPAEWVKKDSAF